MSVQNSCSVVSTHAPEQENHVSTRSYQHERINIFVAPRYRQQLDALANEWNVSLVETCRRVLASGLRNVMLTDVDSNLTIPANSLTLDENA